MNNLIRRLMRSFFGTMGIKLVNLVLVYAISVFLARKLGPQYFGVYSFSIAVANLFVVFAAFGMPALVIRETVKSRLHGEHSEARGMLVFGQGVVLFVSLLLVAAVHTFLFTYPDALRDGMRRGLMISVWIVPVLASIRLWEGALKGLHKASVSQIASMLIRPLIMLTSLGFFALAGYVLTYQLALSIMIASMLGALAFAFISFVFLKPSNTERLTEHSSGFSFQARPWLAAGFAMMLIGSARFVSMQTDRIMLGILSSPEQVGFYTAAARNAQIVDILMAALDVVLASVVVDRFTKGDREGTQKILTITVRAVFLLSLLYSTALYLLSPFILGLFGEEFVAGQTTFLILLVSRLIGIGFGSVGLILAMTGREREAVVWLWFGACLNVVLNYLLIPNYGMEGAAIATLISALIWKLNLVRVVLTQVGLDPTLLGRMQNWYRTERHESVWLTLKEKHANEDDSRASNTKRSKINKQ